MNSKHARTFEAILTDPVSASIEWSDIESLLIAIGCERKNKKQKTGGSRVKFVKDKMVASFHRPHPQKEAKKYQVEQAREYLTRLGIAP